MVPGNNKTDVPQKDDFSKQESAFYNLETIWKYKWAIIGVTVACTLIMALYVFFLPDVYSVSMLIEPPAMGADQQGRPILIDSPKNIQEKINQQIYNERIMDKIDKGENISNLDFTAKMRNGTELILVQADFKKSDLDQGYKALEYLLQLLQDDYTYDNEGVSSKSDKKLSREQNSTPSVMAERKKTEIEERKIAKQIEMKENRIEQIKKYSASEEAHLENVQSKLVELSDQITKASNSINQINQTRDKIVSEGAQSNSLLLYSMTLQHSMDYYKQLADQYDELRKEKETIQRTLFELQASLTQTIADKETLLLDKDRLALQKAQIKNVSVVQGPEISAAPVGPKRARIIAITAVFSLIGMLILVYLLGSYKKNSFQ